RWGSVDPLAENHYNFSPYNYVLDNPLSFVDPFGLDTMSANNLTGEQWANFNTDKDVLEIDEVHVPRPLSNGYSGGGGSMCVSSRGSERMDPVVASRPFNYIEYRRRIESARDPAVELMMFASTVSTVGDLALIGRFVFVVGRGLLMKGAAKTGGQLSTRFVSTSKGLTDLQPTLNRIASGGKFPHRNDGSIFKNLEGLLPKQNSGFYREFVHPTPGVTGPGPMR